VNIYYVIIATISFLMALIAIIAPFLMIQGLKSEFRSTLSDLVLKSGQSIHDIQAMKTEVSRLNFEHYDKLEKKVVILQGDFATASTEIKAVDSALKTFYSKWAKKLGGLSKPEPHEVAPPVLDVPEGLELPEGFATTPDELQPEAVAANGFANQGSFFQ